MIPSPNTGIKNSAPYEAAAARIAKSPDDFEAWQDLLHATKLLEGGLNRYSSDKALQVFRSSFDLFLKKFPLCHGYWTIYAQSEFNYGFGDRAIAVYQRAVNTVPCSVPLWTSYVDFVMTYRTKEPTKVRALFELASNFIGHHFLANSFWSKYLDFERCEAEIERSTINSSNHRVFKLLDIIVRIPLHQYAFYFSQLRLLLSEIPLQVALTDLQNKQFDAELELELAESGKSKSEMTPNQIEADLRARLTSHYIEIYLSTQADVAQRFPYEITIRRPFFHIAYVSEADMVSWRRYLSFEEILAINNPGHHSRVKLLYERAILPTGHREEFWLRYARWLTAHNYIGEARNVYRQACAVIPISTLNIRHNYAKFEHALGNIQAANTIYQTILDKFPSSFETLELYAGLHDLLPESSGYDALNQLAWTTTDTDAQFYIKLLMAQKFNSGPEQARAAFHHLVKQYPQSFRAFRAFLTFELEIKDGPRIQDAVSALEASQLSFADKKQLIHLYMVYLLDQADDGLAQYLVLNKKYTLKSAAIAV